MIYNQFCNFEIAPVLEMLSMSHKHITIFAKTLGPIKSEEGLMVLPEKTVDDLKIEEYDSLILPDAIDIRETIEDDTIIDFIKQFADMPIGAISIAPLLLLKADLLKDKPFMAGVNREELAEEGYTAEDLVLMIGWDDNLKNPIEKGYIVSDNIVTSVSYNFIKWTLAFGELIGIKLSPKTFGL